VRRDEAVHAAATVTAIRERAPGQHALEDAEQVFGHLEIRHIAGVVKSDEDFIGQAARVSWDGS